MYEFGQGVKKDPFQAFLWYQKAAEQGFAEAQFKLGKCYSTGEGVPIDSGQALIWFRKAADQGHVRAKEALNVPRL
jgi:hypothetical protein